MVSGLTGSSTVCVYGGTGLSTLVLSRRIVAGDDFQQQGGVGDGVGEGADLVERAGVGDEAEARDAAVGRLEADDAAQAAGWRIEPPVSVPSASGASHAATAAAEPPLEPPGMRSRSHGLRVT